MKEVLTETHYNSIRKRSLDILTAKKFQVAGALPVGPAGDRNGLRPLDEIGRRLWALDYLFLYASTPGKSTPGKHIKIYLVKNDLVSSLTDEERKIMSRWRWAARRAHAHSIGWRLENMLPLAWILGFESPPTVEGEMLDGEPLQRLICDFIGDINEDFDNWLEKRTARSEMEVVEMEDLFYCAHNAVRSAQLGGNTVPRSFHPIANGGVVHERRHALTWALSPGVNWDDTDLST
jgi:hypothetical protein